MLLVTMVQKNPLFFQYFLVQEERECECLIGFGFGLTIFLGF